MNDIIMGIAVFIAGVLGAMGLGGGGVLIIYLTLFMAVDQLVAQGINLFFFMATAVVSIVIHSRNGYINYKILPKLILWAIPGVFLGIYLREQLPTQLLGKAFGLLLIIMGISEIFGKKQNNRK